MTTTQVILLADDDPNDILIVKEAFKRAGYDNPFVVVKNGEEAISYLKGEDKYANRKKYPIPALLLLDLKMPRIDGFEVLQWVRSRPEWRCLPIIVLTNSYFGPDINRAYDLGANSFLTKPADFLEYVGAVKQVAHFWLIHNVIPEPGPFVVLPQAAPADASANVPQLDVSRKTAKKVERKGRLQGSPEAATESKITSSDYDIPRSDPSPSR